MRKLGEAVKENEQSDFTKTTRFHILGRQNHLLRSATPNSKKDPLDLRTRAFYQAWDTANVVFLLNRKYVLTTSWFWNVFRKRSLMGIPGPRPSDFCHIGGPRGAMLKERAGPSGRPALLGTSLGEVRPWALGPASPMVMQGSRGNVAVVAARAAPEVPARPGLVSFSCPFLGFIFPMDE